MITLNLLAPGKQEEWRLRRTFLSLRNTSALLLVLTAFGTMALLLAQLSLETEYADFVQRLNAAHSPNRLLDLQTRELNAQIGQLAEGESAFTPWSQLLIDLAERTPAGIGYSDLRLDQRTGALLLRGTAADREAFLVLKSNLEQAAFAKALESPLSNLLQPTAVPFELRLEVIRPQLPSL